MNLINIKSRYAIENEENIYTIQYAISHFKSARRTVKQIWIRGYPLKHTKMLQRAKPTENTPWRQVPSP